MKLHGIAFAALALALQAAAQTGDPQAWADALVDSPAAVGADDAARAAQWLDRIEQDPAHPLVEVALRLVDRAGGEDPAAVDRRVLALSPARMTAAAAAVLTRMQSERRVRRAPLAQLGRWKPGELYGDRLSRGLVLGPLPDVHDAAARASLFADPGFEREHAGPYEWKLRWQPLVRPAAEPAFDPDDAVFFESGWAMSAFFFDVPGGGPAWLELDFSEDAGPRWVTILSAREGSFMGSLDDPSCEFALNGAAPAKVDFLSAERSPVERRPVVLRDGRNRLLLASNLRARVRFAIRLLGADGRPLPRVVEQERDAALGAEVAAQPPSAPFACAETYLAALPARGATLETLLGLVELFDARYSAAAAHLAHAVELEPARVGTRIALAELYGSSSYLPDTWRRSRQRELIERLVADDASNARMQLALARILAPEDREEEALKAVEAVASVAPSAPDVWLTQSDLYGRLELEVPAERALLEAERRAPHSLRVRAALAEHWDGAGQPLRALEQREAVLREGGFEIDSLDGLAGAQAALGRADEALQLYRAAAAIGAESELNGLASHLQGMQRFEEADAVLAELELRHVNVPYFALRRADIAHLRGDRDAELIHLREALRRDVSNESARRRLFALTGEDDTESFFQRWATDPAKELAGFDPKRWKEHVVRQIDSAVLRVFPDGAWEQVTHERDVAGDLAGCEALGKLSPQGELLRIATIKSATGVEYEPVQVDGEYVMPALEPGDVVEVVARTSGSAPADGRVRLPKWFFASNDKPFALSRFVISLPKSLELRMVLRNFDGQHTTRDEGDSVVHEFVRRDSDRVVAEPGSPPNEWYLPWVAFVEDRPLDSIAEELAEYLVVPTRVTPEIRAAALGVVKDATGELERAKLLYAFAQTALDKRAPNSFASATAALLTREGNAALLYSALLDAVGVDNELVWSRGVSPEADPEPDPAVVDTSRWARAVFVLVRPKDAPEAWCELSSKTMPYGRIVQGTPRAPAFATRSRRWIAMPDVPLAEQPGQNTNVVVRLGAERSADVELEFRLGGNASFPVKEQLREAPKAQIKQLMQRVSSQLVTGLTMKDHELRGLDDADAELVFSASGTHKSFLDEQKGELVCKLPFPALQLARVASGEGKRTQPLFRPSAQIDRTRARFELPEGLTLAQPLAELREEFHGATYRLALEDVSERGFTVVREFLQPAGVLKAEDYAEFVAFAKRVDEAERTRLRFTRAP